MPWHDSLKLKGANLLGVSLIRPKTNSGSGKIG